MGTIVGKFLQRWPRIYECLNVIFFSFSPDHLMAIIKGTHNCENYWKTRKDGNIHGFDSHLSSDWVESYWKSIDHPHRKSLHSEISTFDPSSVLEIGSNCGPNLYLLAKTFPNMRLFGIDINSESIEKGNALFDHEGLTNVKLEIACADNLSSFKEKSIDVIFSDATLIYIGPDKIESVIKEMNRVAKKAIILIEWHTNSDTMLDKKGKGRYYLGKYVRNYVRIFGQIVPEKKISVKKLPKGMWEGLGWEKFGHIITIT